MPKLARAAVLVLSLLVLARPAAAEPASAHEHAGGFQFRSEVAEASFATADATGIVTEIWVYAADDTAPDRVSKAVVYLSRTDPSCVPPGDGADPKASEAPGTGAGCALISAECYADLDDAAFAVDNHQLHGAWLDAVVPCYDHVTGGELNLGVSLTWAAAGERERDHVNQLFHLQGGPHTATRHLHVTSRAAVATGSVTDGTTDFTPGPSAEALVIDAQEIMT